MDSKKLAQLCREFADNKKAENIVILDVRKLSSVTDYFVIASGTSEPHLRAIVEEITGELRERAWPAPGRTDGSVQGAWVVLDFFDVIVHVMRHDVREHYDLEGLWGDAKRVKTRDKIAKRTEASQYAQRSAAVDGDAGKLKRITAADASAGFHPPPSPFRRAFF